MSELKWPTNKSRIATSSLSVSPSAMYRISTLGSLSEGSAAAAKWKGLITRKTASNMKDILFFIKTAPFLFVLVFHHEMIVDKIKEMSFCQAVLFYHCRSPRLHFVCSFLFANDQQIFIHIKIHRQ